jgi:phenylpropionate dioxygenase-like ring-hydroxylating dioxygenase large terminal subunit
MQGNWVDVASGVVSRDAFVSDDVYHREIDRIFERNWVYLAHESEIPAAGSYVVRTLGNAPVIVVRDADNSIYAVLNSCRHRGAKLCRADSGTVRRFVCPYHGWSYERDGKLITTTFDALLPKEMDFAQWSLVRVPRVDSHKGLIFGCWDRDAIGLQEYLGDFRWYLDAFVARSPGGMEVLAPPHRWRAKCNWKVGALNFIGDGQHILTTHIGPITLDPVRAARSGFAKPADTSIQVMTDGGHGLTLTYLQPGLPDAAYATHPSELLPLYEKSLDPRQAKMLQRLRVSVGTVFPNLSFIETQIAPSEKAVIMRLWHPVSGSEMEVLSWVLAEREARPDYKERVLRKGFHNFGAAGVFEQDDLELWESATAASRNQIAQQFPYSFHSAVPYLDKPLPDYDGPGRAYQPSAAEVIQFEFMRHWERVMTANV